MCTSPFHTIHLLIALLMRFKSRSFVARSQKRRLCVSFEDSAICCVTLDVSVDMKVSGMTSALKVYIVSAILREAADAKRLYASILYLRSLEGGNARVSCHARFTCFAAGYEVLLYISESGTV